MPGLGTYGVEGSKPSNPKDALGVMKVALSYVSMPVMMEAALGMMEGGHKYGRHNYRSIGVRASIYYDAAMRHLTAWWEGEDCDPDSQLSHITKAITSLIVLRDAMIQDMWTDDRPPKSPAKWIDKLNDNVKKLNEKYPNPKKPYTNAASD